MAKIESELGPIDLALFGAGMYVPFDIRNIDLDGFHRTMALNVDGVINGDRRGAAFDAGAEVGSHRHHGLAVRLFRLAGAMAPMARARRR